LAGAIYDATQSYDIPFYMAGALFGLSAITSFIAPTMKRCTTPTEVPPITDVLTPIDEDVEEEIEEERNVIPEIIETAASPINPAPSQPQEIKQIESVL
jgi:hypothetical protein